MTRADARGWRGRWLPGGVIAACGAVLAIAACGDPGGRSEYEVDGDTGAAAPATVLDQNTAKSIGPDSVGGRSERTGRPAMAGDTTGARGQPAGPPDSLARAAGAPPPGR